MENLFTLIKMPLAAVVGAYLLFLFLVYLFQSHMVYFPYRKMEGDPSMLGLGYEEVWFEADDGTSLFGWYVPAGNGRGTLLFLHGNAGNISHRLDSIEIFHSMGLNLFIFDYRGYGRSGGSPDEADIYDDARCAWKYLMDEKGARPGEIIIFGRSLGAAVAAHLASRTAPGGLIAESGFVSVKALVKTFYAHMVPPFLVRCRYDTLAYLRKVRVPVLVIHSQEDELIPFAHGRALFDAANEPKTFLPIRGSHNHGFMASGRLYTDGLEHFVKDVLNGGER